MASAGEPEGGQVCTDGCADGNSDLISRFPCSPLLWICGFLQSSRLPLSVCWLEDPMHLNTELMEGVTEASCYVGISSAHLPAVPASLV